MAVDRYSCTITDIHFADLPGFSGVMDDDDEEMEVDQPASTQLTPKKAGTKRSNNSSPRVPTKRPPLNTADKPDCKYGVKCYQKGKDHRDKFSHPLV